MAFKPRVWYPLAVGLSAVNLVAVWFAARPAEPLHATIHAALALSFGLWAQRLRARAHGETVHYPLELEVDQLRQDLLETQERLDFAERVLAQSRPADRADLDR